MTQTTTTPESTTDIEAAASRIEGGYFHATCPGCDQVLHIGDLAAILGESVHTLYKYSAIGFPAFPKRLRLRNGRVVTTCRLVKSWMAEVAS